MTDTPGRCETGGCITVTFEADRVNITETDRPDETVTTSRANWDTFVAGIEAPLRAEVERLNANQQPDGGQWQHGYWGPLGRFVVFDAETTRAALADEDDRNLVRRRRVWYGPVEPITEAADE